MADREKVLRYFKAGGDEVIAGKLLDMAEGARKCRKFKVSDFLDPHGQNVAEIVAANFPNIKMSAEGCFANAERKRVAYSCEEFYGSADFAIEAFAVKWDKRYYEISHRDILGAFTGMGCTRDVLGDIVFTAEGAQFVADKNMENFIECSFTPYVKDIARAVFNSRKMHDNRRGFEHDKRLRVVNQSYIGATFIGTVVVNEAVMIHAFSVQSVEDTHHYVLVFDFGQADNIGNLRFYNVLNNKC